MPVKIETLISELQAELNATLRNTCGKPSLRAEWSGTIEALKGRIKHLKSIL